MTFGERLQQARQTQGLSQAELAEKTGLFQSEISRFEIGQARPSLTILRRLAKKLTVTPNYLRGLERPNENCND